MKTDQKNAEKTDEKTPTPEILVAEKLVVLELVKRTNAPGKPKDGKPNQKLTPTTVAILTANDIVLGEKHGMKVVNNSEGKSMDDGIVGNSFLRVREFPKYATAADYIADAANRAAIEVTATATEKLTKVTDGMEISDLEAALTKVIEDRKAAEVAKALLDAPADAASTPADAA